MDRLSVGRELLSTAEAGLRDLGAKAAKSGDYDEVMLIADVAKGLHDLATRIESPNGRMPTSTTLNGALSRQAGPEDVKDVAKSGLTRGRKTAAKSGKKSRRSTRKNGYPRFLRRGNDLVKIGWSKGSAKEYQHKAPHSVLVAVAKSLCEKAPSGEVLSTDEFLPTELPESGEEIPAYQAYVCLAWLRSTGLVNQKGRQGYSLSDAESLTERIEEEWSRMRSK